VTKPVTAYACLIAAEEGVVDLDEPAGPPGSTVRHLLAHASGLPFDGLEPIAPPGRRRIYSNTGFERVADHVADRAEMPFAEYLLAAVFEPLGMAAELRETAAAGLWGSLDDLVAFAGELMRPRLLAPETLAEATEVQFPGLNGVLPDFGRMDPNDWGLGLELRDAKAPH
jgi:CubicO group peptidase (beta-lactamase class C family)